MARLKAVFFDLGGTLMEDEGDRNAKVSALAAVNARYGIPKTGAETLRWFLKDLAPYYAGQPEKWIPIRDHLRRNFVAYLREHGRTATGGAQKPWACSHSISSGWGIRTPQRVSAPAP